MNNSDIIKAFIKKDNIASALELLKQRATMLGNWDIQSDMEKIEFSYNAMLDYMLQNYVDENTKKLRENTKLDLLTINDRLDRVERYKERPADLYCLAMRNFQQDGAFLENICEELVKTNIDLDLLLNDNDTREAIKTRKINELRQRIEDLRVRMFESVWSCNLWNSSNSEFADSFVDNENIDEDTRAIFISAVTLSLLEYFDIKKLNFLFDSYLSNSSEISIRALVGVVLSIRHYSDRIRLHEELKTKVKLLSDDTQFVKDMLLVCVQLQLCCTTDTIMSRMNNDILPAIMAGSAFKDAIGTVSNKKNIIKDENPEWVDFKANEKAEKKIREMADLQIDGADIYFSNFRLMKNYDFFHQLPHWFYPFDKDSIFVCGESGKQSTLTTAILNSAPFCNSDLYSFAISVKYFDSLGDDAFSTNMMGGMSDVELSVLKEQSEIKKNVTNRERCRSYVFDLYRFFHLFKQGSQFFNPFKHSITGVNGEYSFLPMDIDVLNVLSFDDEDVIELGNVLLRNGLYSYAYKVYTSISIPEIEENANLFQKIGFCIEKDGGNAEAYYEKACMLAPGSVWTLKHLIPLLIEKEEYDKCIGYCQELLAVEPENTKALYNLSLCFCKTGLYNEALEYAYKLQYLAPDAENVHGLMVECFLGINDMDKLCEIVMGSDDINDTLISAFVFVQEENYIGAHELFKMAWDMWAKDTNKDKLSFEQRFNEIYALCQKYINLDDTIVRMIYDALILR